MNIEIITIGDELLIGQVIDTNSAWIGQEVNHIGWEVVRITSVRDRIDEMTAAFSQALARVDIVLVTGGLGPTKDDITKEALCRFFGGKLIFNESVFQNIEQIFWSRSHTVNDSTRSQAYVPDCCTVIQNRMGTAPIMWFEQNGKVLISMPGVPYEMKYVMLHEIIPRLEKQFSDGSQILHRVCLVKDYTESMLSERLTVFEKQLPCCIKLAYLPAPQVIRLRLTARGEEKNMITAELDNALQQLRNELGNSIFCERDLSLSEIIGEQLRERQWRLSTAESCTSGGIATAITAIAGSSDYFSGSVVAYSNNIKESVLGVSSQTLQQYGAVSAETVTEMCSGVSRLMNTECAIATSGIAGPSGGSPQKPVGTVWIGVKCGEETAVRLYQFGNNRQINTMRAIQAAQLFLIEMLAKK